jgi:hypothetical protein
MKRLWQWLVWWHRLGSESPFYYHEEMKGYMAPGLKDYAPDGSAPRNHRKENDQTARGPGGRAQVRVPEFAASGANVVDPDGAIRDSMH